VRRIAAHGHSTVLMRDFSQLHPAPAVALAVAAPTAEWDRCDRQRGARFFALLLEQVNETDPVEITSRPTDEPAHRGRTQALTV
jgi:hypothetical protein